jgi:hypothetical protein
LGYFVHRINISDICRLCKTEVQAEGFSIPVPFGRVTFLNLLKTLHLPQAYFQAIFTGTAKSMRYAPGGKDKYEGQLPLQMVTEHSISHN